MNSARKYRNTAARAPAWQGNVAVSTRVVDYLWSALVMASRNKLALVSYALFILSVTSPTTTAGMYTKAKTVSNGTAAAGIVTKLGAMNTYMKEIFLVLPLAFSILDGTRLGLYVSTERLAVTVLFTIWALTSASTRIWELFTESVALWAAMMCRGGSVGVLATGVAAALFLINSEVSY